MQTHFLLFMEYYNSSKILRSKNGNIQWAFLSRTKEVMISFTVILIIMYKDVYCWVNQANSLHAIIPGLKRVMASWFSKTFETLTIAEPSASPDLIVAYCLLNLNLGIKRFFECRKVMFFFLVVNLNSKSVFIFYMFIQHRISL